MDFFSQRSSAGVVFRKWAKNLYPEILCCARLNRPGPVSGLIWRFFFQLFFGWCAVVVLNACFWPLRRLRWFLFWCHLLLSKILLSGLVVMCRLVFKWFVYAE